MKCEICKVIARLGLDESTHDLWHCADAGLMKTVSRKSRNYLHEIGELIQHFARSYSRYYHHRRALITLEI